MGWRKKKKEPDISRFQIENVNAVKGEEEEEEKISGEIDRSIELIIKYLLPVLQFSISIILFAIQ